MIRVRAHHLLCMLNFEGKGYNEDFVKNLANIIKRIEGGETIQLVEGPDDICAPLACDPDEHCHNASVRERDANALARINDVSNLGLQIESGLQFDQKLWDQLKAHFREFAFRKVCEGCEWTEICYREG